MYFHATVEALTHPSHTRSSSAIAFASHSHECARSGKPYQKPSTMRPMSLTADTDGRSRAATSGTMSNHKARGNSQSL